MKKRILFVDDNPDMLSSLQRMLRVVRSEWEMGFVESGRKALEELAKIPYDVVVSDIRMPEMDGVELLTKVKKLYPRVVRIALSGQSDQEVVLKSVGSTHQFLAKPCDADALKAVILRSCALQDLLCNASLQKIVTELESLPSLPSLYLEIIEELKSPKSSLAKIGEIISKDIGMTAKILQLVNSAFFGMPQHISSPSQAATLLGVDIIRALVLSVKIFSSYSSSIPEQLNIERLWNHCNMTAVLAKEIANSENFDRKMIDDVFMAGILHDVGILVLASNLPEQYNEVLQITEQKNMRLIEAEQLILGKTHAEVGGYLIGLWGLPDTIVETIYFHHTPGDSPIISLGPLTVVHIANALETTKTTSKDAPIESYLDMEYLNKLGIADRVPFWCAIQKEIRKKGTDNK